VVDRDANNPSDQIGDYLREGQSLVVQVTKDPISSKGARLTTHLSIPSRYLVYMPDQAHVGVSQRIEDEVERERLKLLVSEALTDADESSGYILRTAAEKAG
jgi:ribonuclease G